MKKIFDSKLLYQNEAINSVVKLFLDVFNLEKPISDNLFHLNGNGLGIGYDNIFSNLVRIQKSNGIIQTTKDEWKNNGLNFSLDMETGTGKTYIFLRTVFQLYNDYGINKYIIVVPNIAVKENLISAYKELHRHLSDLYNNQNAGFTVYESSKMSTIKRYIDSSNLEILLINIDSINKKDNLFNRKHEYLSDYSPRDKIKNLNPFCIIDEPQSMESKISSNSIIELNPLVTIRYSATHKKTYNSIYKLDPYKAHNLGLVKTIEVDSVALDNGYNEVPIRILSITHGSRGIRAVLQIIEKNGSIKKITINKYGQDLYALSNYNNIYTGYLVENIDSSVREVSFQNGIVISELNISDDAIKDKIMEMQVEQTVKNHFDKERYFKKILKVDLKVLSLFFIDKVKNFRGEQPKIKIWLEKYIQKYAQDHYDADENIKPVYASYFSIDSKGNPIDSTQNFKYADVNGYNLIFKNKDSLINSDNPIRFIVTHSALKEGWDCPNIFQICTLNESFSYIKKRQEIGRGLRLPLMRNGERSNNSDINTLTIVSNESYDQFAKNLQDEIEQEFDIIGGINIVKDKRKKVKIEVKNDYDKDPNFLFLWELLKYKPKYNIQINSDKLVKEVSGKIERLFSSTKKISVQKAKLNFHKNKISTTQTTLKRNFNLDTNNNIVKDVSHFIQEKTKLKISTIRSILVNSKIVKHTIAEPESVIEIVSDEINKSLFYNDNAELSYEIGTDFYQLSIMASTYSFTKNFLECTKSIYDKIILDSKIEELNARQLENVDSVSFFLKLPRSYKIPTPLGNYSPDWAIVINEDNKKYRIIFESKGVDYSQIEELRLKEIKKIKYAKKYYSIFDEVKFDFGNNFIEKFPINKL